MLDRSTFGDGNQQLECQMKSNVSVADGRLTLVAQQEVRPVQCGSRDARFPGGRSYTGATIETSGRSAFQYGYVEMRAKLPVEPGTSKGLWPAFWLRPTDGGFGEIDVLEAIGTSSSAAKDAAHLTIHHDYSGGIGKQTSTISYPSGSLSSEYHRYGVDWEPGSLTWYIDGRAVWTRSTTTTPWLDSTFARPFFLRLNLAVGGTWPGSPDAATVFPKRYDVDWVRVYQR
ncbi:glycoside hydrolase family 16 protein [Amnibacterium setariae]|uniref:Glycoside hydrolase family 16 protein n=1 Tax=Amnibacterium setariae TaxID=2306585 RepID=A0A3A1TY53_9MICO|nr:glycoside hydrolase family 16 protein [Amnibacterium setariae]